MSSPPKKPKLSAKQKYKKHYMEVGQRGFLATCNFKQRDCIRECYNILNQYADIMYGPVETALDPQTEKENDDEDVIDDLLKQVDAIAKQKHTGIRKRFEAVDTGVTNCIFVRTQLPDPQNLCTRIIDDIAGTKKALSRFLLRLLPVEVICRANNEDILAKAGLLFDRYFIKQKCTFAIVFNRRFNNDISREFIIRELAQLVHSKNPQNSVDLKNAEKTVIVEVIKGLCCLSVVPDYMRYRKFNLVELAKLEEPRPKVTPLDTPKTTNAVAEAQTKPAETAKVPDADEQAAEEAAV